jgi:Icc-related predicted phosphoesterase
VLLRLYFASDVHGSNRCWLKFLAAARFYEADAIVMGADITGKVVVPIIREEDGTTWANFLGLGSS